MSMHSYIPGILPSGTSKRHCWASEGKTDERTNIWKLLCPKGYRTLLLWGSCPASNHRIVTSDPIAQREKRELMNLINRQKLYLTDNVFLDPSLYEGASVGRSIGWSVCRSVGWSVARSVDRSVHNQFFLSNEPK